MKKAEKNYKNFFGKINIFFRSRLKKKDFREEKQKMQYQNRKKQQYIVQKNKIKIFSKKVKKGVDKSKAKRYNRRAVRETAEKKPVMRQQMNLEK